MPQSNLRKESLPYFADSAALFSAIAGKPWAIFLDSGYPSCTLDRYDILVAEPVCTLVTRGGITEITRDGHSVQSAADPFELVKLELGKIQQSKNELPFKGGAIGYFAYDLARRIERLDSIAADLEQIPEMAVGIYEWAVVVDHRAQKTYLAGIERDPMHWQRLLEQFSRLPDDRPEAPFRVLSEIRTNMDKGAYFRAFNRIKHYLTEGDCYQVNLSQRFSADCEGDPWTAYRKLRELNAAPFSAYMNLPGVQVLSSSPECFLRLINGKVTTKPIKGTRPRKADAAEDRQQIEILQHSSKDRAENLMIVDLLRNDISKTCKQGSVRVPKIFAVETYATVHHLVSTVTGVLEDGRHALDLLKHCFPGGSITGAPKIRAMEIIEELEPSRRGLYCGSIGYIGFDGNMDSNIVIRTLVHSDGEIRFWAGGGIVNDSAAEEEYQECFDKAAALLDLLRQFSVKR
ncbi:MAG: aminodeoxychorismate synthase component I [Methylococcaceae bacterium]|nr:aminodeoxychorismate synthase component I [Methylococcaceae bacterium]